MDKTTPADQQLDHQQFKNQQGSAPKEIQLSLLLHDFQSPRNVGGLFRLADALGIHHIYLSGDTPAPPNRKLRQTSRSTEKHVSHSIHSDYAEVLNALKTSAVKTIGLEISQNSQALEPYLAAKQAEPIQKLCLIPGSESAGLNVDLLNACTDVIHIPMAGQNSSMNVTAACAIACYRLLGS